MSASLVGSEMCIRDRLPNAHPCSRLAAPDRPSWAQGKSRDRAATEGYSQRVTSNMQRLGRTGSASTRD
eukprot:7502482-Alexandrium_andersonii.AAC.1